MKKRVLTSLFVFLLLSFSTGCSSLINEIANADDKKNLANDLSTSDEPLFSSDSNKHKSNEKIEMPSVKSSDEAADEIADEISNLLDGDDEILDIQDEILSLYEKQSKLHEKAKNEKSISKSRSYIKEMVVVIQDQTSQANEALNKIDTINIDMVKTKLLIDTTSDPKVKSLARKCLDDFQVQLASKKDYYELLIEILHKEETFYSSYAKGVKVSEPERSLYTKLNRINDRLDSQVEEFNKSWKAFVEGATNSKMKLDINDSQGSSTDTF